MTMLSQRAESSSVIMTPTNHHAESSSVIMTPTSHHAESPEDIYGQHKNQNAVWEYFRQSFVYPL